MEEMQLNDHDFNWASANNERITRNTETGRKSVFIFSIRLVIE